MTDYEMIFLCKLAAFLIAYGISLGLAYNLGKLRVLYIWQKADEAEEAAREAEEDEMLQDMEENFAEDILNSFVDRIGESIINGNRLADRAKWYEQFNEEDFEDGNEE